MALPAELVSAITDPTSTKLEIITLNYNNNYKNKTRHSKPKKKKKISAFNDLNRTKLKLGFWINFNNFLGL